VVKISQAEFGRALSGTVLCSKTLCGWEERPQRENSERYCPDNARLVSFPAGRKSLPGLRCFQLPIRAKWCWSFETKSSSIPWFWSTASGSNRRMLST